MHVDTRRAPLLKEMDELSRAEGPNIPSLDDRHNAGAAAGHTHTPQRGRRGRKGRKRRRLSGNNNEGGGGFFVKEIPRGEKNFLLSPGRRLMACPFFLLPT